MVGECQNSHLHGWHSLYFWCFTTTNKVAINNIPLHMPMYWNMLLSVGQILSSGIAGSKVKIFKDFDNVCLAIL